jgi:murein tripeptide amidase MpaA
MTGATHARELISTSMNVYEMLKLLKYGELDKTTKYEKLLNQNKYMFVPILNVDGVNYIEEQW